MTERDILHKVVARNADTASLTLGTEKFIDWLRIMSKERFRRPPVVDEDERIKAVFAQGD